jgi:hypothetical protein
MRPSTPPVVVGKVVAVTAFNLVMPTSLCSLSVAATVTVSSDCEFFSRRMIFFSSSFSL